MFLWIFCLLKINTALWIHFKCHPTCSKKVNEAGRQSQSQTEAFVQQCFPLLCLYGRFLHGESGKVIQTMQMYSLCSYDRNVPRSESYSKIKKVKRWSNDQILKSQEIEKPGLWQQPLLAQIPSLPCLFLSSCHMWGPTTKTSTLRGPEGEAVLLGWADGVLPSKNSQWRSCSLFKLQKLWVSLKIRKLFKKQISIAAKIRSRAHFSVSLKGHCRDPNKLICLLIFCEPYYSKSPTISLQKRAWKAHESNFGSGR